jgi:hypothetical protein
MDAQVVAGLDRAVFAPGGYPSEEALQALELTLRTKPFMWGDAFTALGSVKTRMFENEGFALNVLDYCLGFCDPGSRAASNLNEVLTLGGSVWEVRPASTGCQLSRRTIGPVPEAIDDLRTINERAHAHLLAAWAKLMGRSSDPSSAYREAVRAVEVVAAPVVTPADPKATLGTIIAAMKAKPSKWTVDLEKATPEQVLGMLQMIWQAQFDRHGTDDESVPLNVSQGQADAAVHIAIALTRLFAGGHIKAV